MFVKSGKNIHVYHCTIKLGVWSVLTIFFTGANMHQLTQLAKCKDPKTILSNLNKNTPHLNLCAPEMNSS